MRQIHLEEKKMYEYPFQKILFDYLDLKSNLLINSPNLEDLFETNTNNPQQFTALISLFHMFITTKIFSHDQFVRDLIARGDCFRNNLNDIKRPINVFMNFKKKQIELKQKQEQQHQIHQIQQQNHLKQSMQHKSQYHPNRSAVDYASPMSVYQQQPASMPPYNLAPHTPLDHQKSFSNLSIDPLYSSAPHSVPTPCKSSLNPPEDLNSSLSKRVKTLNSLDVKPVKLEPGLSAKQTNSMPMSKLAIYVLNLPLPQTQSYQHERNQRFVILYGFGAKKQEILERIHSVTKMFQRLLGRKYSIDLNDVTTITSLSNSSMSKRNASANNKHFNTVTNLHVSLSLAEIDSLNQIQFEYSKMSLYDQYSIVSKISVNLIEIFKSLEQKNYLPKLQFIQFVFDLMESNMNVFNLFLFTIRLLHVGPLIEQYLRVKFIFNISSNTKNSAGSISSTNSSAQNSSYNNNNKSYYFEYLSHFYLNIVGVLRLHLISLVLWKDLAIEVFKCLFKLVKHVERPSRCSSHEKCSFMLLNEMYTTCGYIKAKFPQFEPIANKIRLEKCFTQAPQIEKTNSNANNYQMKSDELLTSMITTTDHTIEEIENYVTSKNLHYNFVAHVFVSISNLNKDEMLRVANLCSELTSRCNSLITFWQNATRALHHRNTEPTKEKAMFNELLNKINIQNPRCKESFKLFLSILASRHCLILNDLIIMVVKTCVMACPGITNDQSHNISILEPSASLACHIIQYLFTSSTKPLQYRRTSTDQRMITASFRCICFNTFLLVLKCLFLISEPKKDTPNNRMSRNNSNVGSNSRIKEEKFSDEQLDLDQFAANVLQEISEHDWVKERCFHEGDNLLKANQLLEPALGRRAQNLLHIICYPQSHDLRKQNDQSSTKDFIRNILQNLDVWTLRESLLEFKLMIELEKQKERFYEYAVECLAKTTVDFLIDQEKSPGSVSNTLHRSISQVDVINTQPSVSSESQSDRDTKSPTTSANLNTNSDPIIKVEKIELEDTEPVVGAIINPVKLENITDSILAETDLNLNLNNDLDHLDRVEGDDFENLELSKPSQPVCVWLIGPLITRLPDTCQLKVLEHASKTLQDLGKAFWNAKNKVEKETQAIKNIIAWNQQPFFSLLISCLKNNNNNEQQQQRTLLTSLFNGLTDFINGKEDKILSEEPRIKQIMLDTLHTRLSLVGSMFDFILKNSNDFVNWAWLFVQLIYSGVVDPDNDQLLFTMILDMLVVLIHHIITLEPNLDNNKHYQSIIKKISKETKDFSDVANTKAINHIRKLMPLNRSSCLEILTVDSYSTTASKTISNLHDKRRGFKFARKEKISTWELIEGVKNASSLCLSWYGSNKLERKMLRYEYQQKLLLRHKHMNIHKELTYFKEKPDIPNDLIELTEPIITEPVVVKKEITPTQQALPTQAQVAQMSSSFNQNESIKMNVQSPGTNLDASAEIVVLGSTMPHQVAQHDSMLVQHSQHSLQQAHPHPNLAMHQQHQAQYLQQPHLQQQMIPNNNSNNAHHTSQMTQNHSQIMNRLQSHMQQHQQQHLIQQPNVVVVNQQMAHMAPGDRKGNQNRSVSTPDKQKAGLKKQKSTTPRKATNLKAGANQLAPMAMQQQQQQQGNKLMGQQQPVASQYQMMPNQQQPGFQNRQTSLNQQPPQQGLINNPVLHQRLPNQPIVNAQPNQQNFYPNSQAQAQIHPPPQSLTPQPPSQTQFIQQQQQQQQPGQQQIPSKNQRLMQQQQQASRIGFSANLPQSQLNPGLQPPPQLNAQQQQQLQQQQQQRKIPNQNQPQIVGNQVKAQVPSYQGPATVSAPRMMPQQGTPVQQPIFQGNNPQMFNQGMIKQTSLPLPAQRTSTTPDPLIMSQNNQVPLLPKQGQQQHQNPTFQQQQPGQRIPIQQQQPTQQGQQRMQFNPNPAQSNQGLTLPTQPANQTNQTNQPQSLNWQQQQQQQQRQQAMQRQQQQQQFQQQQYLPKQLSNNAQAQQPPQQQGYNLGQQAAQSQSQPQPQQQQRQMTPQLQPQTQQQQYQNY